MILKLKRTPGIYLVGFMACGKTTVGRMLADVLGWCFVDLDAEIESNEQCSISEIFDTRGEEEFRRIETAQLFERVRIIEKGNPTVLALGGGAFARPENHRIVKANGISVWLDCPLVLLEERVAREAHRPLARDPQQFAALYEARLQSYANADYRVRIAGNDPLPVLEQVLALPIF